MRTRPVGGCTLQVDVLDVLSNNVHGDVAKLNARLHQYSV